MVKTKGLPNMTVGRAALLGLMRRYLGALMDPFVTLLEIHKLMYFMQEAGEGLRLDYEKGHYGPYARKLRHVLSHIEGHFITGYGDADDAPDKQIELKVEAAERAEQFLGDHPETRDRFSRVVDLIGGFDHSDLANGIGNLISRIASLCSKIGFVSPPRHDRPDAPAEYTAAIQGYEFGKALAALWQTVKGVDQDIEKQRPWELANDERRENLEQLLTGWLDRIWQFAVWLEPFLPATSRGIVSRLFAGTVSKASPLFPRL